MKEKFLDKRIPSLLGLLFLAISVGVVSWFGKNYTELRSKASAGETPKQLQISNITDTSFNVSYITDDSVIGVINYGRDPELGQVGLDDRDQKANTPTDRRVHYITISNLTPNTKYYFTIQSGGKIFLNKNNQPYEVVTPSTSKESSKPPASSNQILAAGDARLPDGNIPTEGIVYVSAISASNSASQLLSGLLKTDGSYNLDLSLLRNADLKSYAEIENDTIFQITIISTEGQSQISIKKGNANSIPTIILSKDYNFTMDTYADVVASDSATASPSGILSPEAPESTFPLFDQRKVNEPNILIPKSEEKFTDQQPLFKGKALPDAKVEIIIESGQKIQINVQADDFGNWQYRPDTPLNPGEHVITILTRDSSGILKSIKRSFTVFAEGSQFTEPSISPTFPPTPTASASPVPTIPPTPTSIPTVILTVSPTASPTAILTTIPTATSVPTSIPTPTLIQTSTPTPTVYPTSASITPPGNSFLLIGSVFTLISIASGFMLFFFL